MTAASVDASSNVNRLYLLDTSIYVFHAWQRLPREWVDVDGQSVNAIHGFLEMLHQLLHYTKPQQLIAAYDDASVPYRREIDPSYKAHRPQRDPELHRQYEWIKTFIAALGIIGEGNAHFEADDVLASYAHKAHGAGIDVTVITADKDLMQLIHSPRDRWWNYHRRKVLDERGVVRTWGVRPDQIADLLAIGGDRSDNIKGVPKVGIKLAAKLLRKFDSIEGIYENIERIHKMKVKHAMLLQENIATHKEAVDNAKKLTQLYDDLPTQPTESWAFTFDTDAALALLQPLNLPDSQHDKWKAYLKA